MGAPKQAFFLTGRSLDNWHARGKTPPADAAIVACLNCGDQLTISVEGVAKIAEARVRGDSPAGALCTLCVGLIAVHPGRPGIEITCTRAGADLVERDEGAKALLDFLIERGAKI